MDWLLYTLINMRVLDTANSSRSVSYCIALYLTYDSRIRAIQLISEIEDILSGLPFSHIAKKKV